jgi:hypothetical protein
MATGAWLARGLSLAAAALAIAAAGGCELIVGDAVPDFTCTVGADTCPAGSVCVPATRQCVPRASTCMVTGCTGTELCDPQSMRCVAATGVGDATALDDASGADGTVEGASQGSDGSIDADTPGADGPIPVSDALPDVASDNFHGPCRGLGCKCSGPPDCDSGVCADQLTATPGLYMANGNMNFCTAPCCTSSDCPTGSVCFGTGSGGNYCVAGTLLGRTNDLGTGKGGAVCNTNFDCRSGLCTSAKVCADTCCSTSGQASECASPSICRFAAFPGANSFDTHITASCGAAIGTTPAGSPCGLDALCQSGKCVGFMRCEPACRSTADCLANQACMYGLAPAVGTKDIIAGCVSSNGTGQQGASCTVDGDCQSQLCDGSHCSDICYADSDCKAGWHCRPSLVMESFGGGSYSILSCGT